MVMKPSNTGQFEAQRMTPEESRRCHEYYFGECGPNQAFYPKRHRWGPWSTHTIKATGVRFRERTCIHCSVVSDPRYLKDRPA